MSFWITGAGAVSCLGLGRERLFASCLKKQSGINSEGLGPISSEDRTTLVHSLGSSPVADSGSLPLQISLWAAREALEEAGWGQLNDRDGLIFATTTGQIPLWDQALSHYYQKQIPLEEFRKVFKHYPLGTILDDFSLQINPTLGAQGDFLGPRTLVTSACGASTQAIAMACMWLETGKADRVIVGGMEFLCDLTIEGFRSLKLLSKERCRPFDVERTGINLSEAAAFFCIEKNKNDSTVKVSGYGLSTDSYHMTAPHPEGEGSFHSMKQALTKSQVPVEDIGWVHAHGTGSLHNDMAEGIAIGRLMDKNDPFISSTKWYHGHALGVSGILEAVLCREGLLKNTQVGTQGLDTLDPKIPIRLSREHGHNEIRAVLKNTLGFGGVNASIVMEKYI